MASSRNRNSGDPRKNQPWRKNQNEHVIRNLCDMFEDILKREEIYSIAQSYNYDLNTCITVIMKIIDNRSSAPSSSHAPNFQNKPHIKKDQQQPFQKNLPNRVQAQRRSNTPENFNEGRRNQTNVPNKMQYSNIVKTIPPELQKNVPKKRNPQLNPVPKNKQEIEFDRLIASITQGFKVLIIIRGLPGSGKTFLANCIYDRTVSKLPGTKREFHVYSTDDYFVWLGGGQYNFNPQFLQEAHSWNQKRAEAGMERGISPIIIDNTNVEAWEMRPYLALAIQFGYMIEILEPCTPWVFNERELSQRNLHGVPRLKIREMIDRYERNLTPKVVLSRFCLQYLPQNMPPQKRVFPELMNKKVNKNVNKKKNKVKKAQVNQSTPVVLNTKTKPENSNDVVLIDFSTTTDNSGASNNLNISTRQASDNLLDSKEENLLQTPLLDFTPEPNNGSVQLRTVDELQKMLASTSISVEKKAEMIRYSRDDLLDVLSQKDKDQVLQILNRVCGRVIEKELEPNTNVITWENLKTISCIEPVVSEAAALPQRPKFMKTEQKSVTDDDSDSEGTESSSGDEEEDNDEEDENEEESNFENVSIENFDKEEETIRNFFEPIVTESSTGTLKHSKIFTFFKSIFDRPSSNINTDKERQKNLITKHDAHTNTECSDFALLVNGGSLSGADISGVRVIATKSRDIGPSIAPRTYREPPKLLMLDKSCLVTEVLLDKNSLKGLDNFGTLKGMFPDIPEDNLAEIFNKCQGDVHWATELLLDSKHNLPDIEFTKKSVEKTETSVQDSQTEVAAIENIPDDVSMKVKKATVSGQLSESVIQLKNHIEERIVISDEHYSPHCLKIRKIKHGEAESSSNDIESITNQNIQSECDSTETESIEDEDDDDFIDLNLNHEFIDRLETKFGVSDVNTSNLEPMVRLPVSLARQIHALWLESIYKQICDQSELLKQIKQEDEKLAQQLQNLEFSTSNITFLNVPDLQEILDMEIALAAASADEEELKNENFDDLVLRITRRKVIELFPSIDEGVVTEVLKAFDDKFEQTVKELLYSTGNATAENIGVKIKEIALKELQKLELTKNERMKVKEESVKKPILVVTDPDSRKLDSCKSLIECAEFYRDEAQNQLKLRNQCIQKAQMAYNKGQMQVATYYAEVAGVHKKKFEQANAFAANYFLNSHSKSSDSKTIDLHFLYVPEAVQALDMFIDKHISSVRTKNKKHEYLYLITGKGSRSPSGKSKIKPAVIKRLKQRSLRFTPINSGFLRVKIRSYDLLTDALPEK